MRVVSRLAKASVCLLGLGVISGAVAPAHAAKQVVRFPDTYAPGTIVIVQHQRRLYLSIGNGKAIRYPVAIGRSGRAWSGWTRVEGKFVRPAWSPPAAVKAWNPRIPNVIPGGSPKNPMGERA
ncbi:MAG: L,D-transpeptidase, partial [Beijerinckiaceae bacterium]